MMQDPTQRKYAVLLRLKPYGNLTTHIVMAPSAYAAGQAAMEAVPESSVVRIALADT
jgi:hypothetical protein